MRSSKIIEFSIPPVFYSGQHHRHNLAVGKTLDKLPTYDEMVSEYNEIIQQAYLTS